MSTTSATSSTSFFTGSSAFSSSLQNAITQALNIASLPLNQLNAQKTSLTNQSDEVTTLNSKFAALQSAISGIDQAVNSSFNTDVSDTTSVSATVGQGAMEGNYVIQVDDVGAYSTMLSGTWNAASGSAQTYQLSIGQQQYSVTPADNSAASVAQAINAQYGDKVRATVVNVGSASAPDNRISIQSVGLTSDTVDLQDSSGTSLAAQQSAGHPAQYEVNQSGNIVSSSSRSVTIATGVTVTLLAQSSSPVNIAVTHSTSDLSNAIQTFSDAYNAAVDEVNGQRGQSAGALGGDPIVNQLSGLLGNLATYSSTGAVGSLADLGLSLGMDGHFTFNAFQLDAADIGSSTAVTSFLGSASGGGFLQTATNLMTSVEDPTTGLIPTEQTNLQNEITDVGNKISDKQTQLSNLQTQLTNQMATADAAISSMEQQYSYLSEMFQAMQVNQQQMAGL